MEVGTEILRVAFEPTEDPEYVHRKCNIAGLVEVDHGKLYTSRAHGIASAEKLADFLASKGFTHRDKITVTNLNGETEYIFPVCVWGGSASTLDELRALNPKTFAKTLGR